MRINMKNRGATFFGLGILALLPLLTLMVAVPASAQLTLPDSVLTYPGCANMTSSDFAVVPLVRGTGTDANTKEPLKMALGTDAQGNVDVYFVQRHGMVRKYVGATQSTVTLANFAFTSGTSLTDSNQVCASCIANGSTFNSSSEGLMAIALDPEFKTNGWVYLYFNMKTVWRVTRYKLTGNTLDVSSGKTIYRVTHPSFSQHMGGALRFDKAGNLWISVSDNASTGNTTSPLATDLRYLSANTNSPFGKVMRIRPRALPDAGAAPAAGAGSTYDIPAGNLRNQFQQVGGRASQDTNKILPEIYVMGARNAYTLAIDSVRNALAWGDVGPDAFGSATNQAQFSEEFNFTKAPGFFGYPYWVGSYNGGINISQSGISGFADFDPLPAGSTTAAPIANYSSATVSHTGIDTLSPARTSIIPYGKACAVTGPVYYYDPNSPSTVKFPPHFHGAWFVGDFNRNWIDAITLNASATTATKRMKTFVSAGGGGITSGYLSTIAITSLPASNGLLEMQMGPDGALYVMGYSGYRTTTAASGIFRVEYRGTCRPTSVAVAFQRARTGVEMARVEGAMLHVTATGGHRVEMRDASGRLLWARGAPGAADYDLRALSGVSGRGTTGLRILTVTASGERFVRKFML